MKFGDYLWQLAKAVLHFKDGSEGQKWTATVGDELDGLKKAAFQVRRAWFIGTSPGLGLDIHGLDRRLPRYKGESDEAYRKRLQAAYFIYALGGTNMGIEEALKIMGYPDAYIHELYKDGIVMPLFNGQYFYNGGTKHAGGNRWSEFKIMSDIAEDKGFTVADLAIIKDTVNRTKSAHTRMASFAFTPAMSDVISVSDRAPDIALALDGSDTVAEIFYHSAAIRYNGTYRHIAGEMRDELRVSTSYENGDTLPGEIIYAADFEHDGGGRRWIHAGSMIRRPWYHYNEGSAHDGWDRWITRSRYGDMRATHNGIRLYNWGKKHDGNIMRGGGTADSMSVTVKRNGQVIEDAA
ncbi:MAG: hypothetical protein PWQ93_1414 [Clostridiales bacterium]|jgi:hypothetical protein|nr:hypothetical protein [Clostridiales bacterium]